MRIPRLLVLDDPDELFLQVRRATASSRPSPEVVWAESAARAEALMGDDGPFDVLVAGPSAVRSEGFQRLRDMRAGAPDTQLVLVLKQWRGSDLRETVRAGAIDVLRMPVGDEALREAIEQAVEVHAGLVPARERVAGDARRADSPGSVIAVVSASGGSGKTFLASNLAYHLQSKCRRQTCLIDLDLQFGELSTALRMRPRATIHDLLSDDADPDAEDLGRRLEETLETHESGIRVLAAPEDPAQADGIDAADVARVIEAARARFDCVVVDTPTALSEAVLVAIEQADQIFVLATLDLPSVRNLGIMLSTLKKLKVPTERVSLLLNKVEPDVGIDVERVEHYFPQGFSMVIPYGREVNRSLNMGQPVLAYAPRGDVSKALAAGLVATVTGAPDTDAEAADRPARQRRRSWSGRKSA